MEIIYDKEEALCAVAQDGMNLRLVNEDLQDDSEVVLTAIENNYCAFQFASDRLQGELSDKITKDDRYYYNIVHPLSGMRYNIPLLSSTDPGYFYRYVEFMKMKERSPNTFERVMNWD